MEAILIDVSGRVIGSFDAANRITEFVGEAIASAPNLSHQDAVDAHVQRQDLQILAGQYHKLSPMNRAALQARGLRQDALDAGNALGLPLEFQFKYNRELDERRRPLRGMELFKRDPSVPVGATSYKIARGFQTGMAKVYNGSNADIPRADATRKSESRPVRYIVIAYAGNVIDLLSTDYAGLDEMGRKRRAAQRAIDEKLNDLIWNGSQDADLYGALTHPDLPKFVSAVPFDGTASAADVLAELNRIANFAHDESGSAFNSNRMAVPQRIRSYLFNTPMFSTGGSDLTIGKYFLQNNEFIKKIDSAAELRGVGPGGTDGIFVYNDDIDSCSYVLPLDYTELPVQNQGFDRMTYAFASFGGARMNNMGDNALMYVEA